VGFGSLLTWKTKKNAAMPCPVENPAITLDWKWHSANGGGFFVSQILTWPVNQVMLTMRDENARNPKKLGTDL
jgi:hypothetical protein